MEVTFSEIKLLHYLEVEFHVFSKLGSTQSGRVWKYHARMLPVVT